MRKTHYLKEKVVIEFKDDIEQFPCRLLLSIKDELLENGTEKFVFG